MMRHKLTLLALTLWLGACVTEDPTDVGDALVSGNDVLTFEVILPASQFLVDDTSFSGYIKPIGASFAVVAHDFEDVLDAHTLYRFSLPPATIVVRTSESTTVVDSAPRFVSGRVVVKFDTLASTARPVALRLFQTAEAWDATATWTDRVDTGTVHVPWSTPGGTRGVQIDTATWADGDSAVFAVDSATLAVWADSTNETRGALLVSETGGSRIRVVGTSVHVDAMSSVRQDTVVNVDLVPSIRTFVFNPTLPTTYEAIRAGGIPSWRSFLRMRSDLRSLVLPCVGGPSGCTVSLDSVHINIAELLLHPARPPAGFSPEDSLLVEARPVSTLEGVPLERLPIGSFAPSARTDFLAPSLFTDPSPNDIVRLDITPFLRHLLDESVDPKLRAPPILALLQLPEAATFGFASFDAEPALRLVLTTALGRRQ